MAPKSERISPVSHEFHAIRRSLHEKENQHASEAQIVADMQKYGYLPGKYVFGTETVSAFHVLPSDAQDQRHQLVKESKQRFLDLEKFHTKKSFGGTTELIYRFRTAVMSMDPRTKRHLDHGNTPFIASIPSIPDEEWITILEQYGNFFAQRQVEIDGDEHNLKEHIQGRFLAILSRYGARVNHDHIHRCINETRAYFFDPLLIDTSNVDGFYDSQTGGVWLRPHYLLNRTRNHNYTHEIVHALAGSTVFKLENYSYVPISVRRLGVHFPFGNTAECRSGFKRGTRPYSRFFWLNEALTERMAMEIDGAQISSDPDDGFTYLEPRKILAFLEAKVLRPIPYRLFLEAAFENYIPEHERKDQIPGWRALWDAINTAFPHPPGAKPFLVQLDYYIQKYGIYGAFFTLKKDWKKIWDQKHRMYWDKKNRMYHDHPLDSQVSVNK